MPVTHVFSNTVSNWTGSVTVFNSQGLSVTAAASNLVKPQEWNSAHQMIFTLNGNTSLTSLISATDLQFAVSGALLTIIGSNSTQMVISSPPHMSSAEFPPEGPNTQIVLSTNSGSVSFAVAFVLQQPISASFIRVPASMSTGSTTLATTAASMSAIAEVQSTWNAVIYSLGTGASSKSLISVASGSAGYTFRNSISVAANGTQYSVTQAMTMPVEGGTTTESTQYSISNTNYSIVSTGVPISNYSGLRWIDIPFPRSLPAGAYWAIIGQSTSLSSNSTGFSNASAAGVRCSGSYYAATQLNSAFGVMGSTNFTSGGLMAAGSFSTAGGGTTTALPISAISSSASHPQLYFQMLRSA